MKTTRLGRTNLTITRTAFGALPVQRVPMDDAVRLLRKAYNSGFTFFDTARGYSDSEEKLGRALEGVRHKVVLATKSGAADPETLRAHVALSLKNLRTDYVDILQLHNPALAPTGNAPGPLGEALLEMKKKGMVRFLGLSNHRLPVARDAAASGLFDTVQFPLSYISSPEDLSLIELCREHDVGLIAMKALCGGLVTNIPAAFAFLRQYDNVVPIWGIQRESELDQFVALDANPPVLDDRMRAEIENDRKELGGSFCRACGYCQPCPVKIQIPMAARMKFLLRRMPYKQFLTDDWRAQMLNIENCTECRECAKKCPYKLDPSTLLKSMLADYKEFYASHAVI